MDLRELRYFESVYELESISAAAKHCFISQPSISTAIQNLEHYLGEILFIRHTRGVAATEAGHKLYPLSKQLTGQAHSIKRLFKEQSAIKPFRLGLARALGASRMSLLMKEIIDAAENLELNLVDPDQTCDARIISKDLLKQDEVFEPLWLDNYLMALPPGHLLSYQQSLSLKDLEGISFILRSPSLVNQNLIKALKSESIKMNIRSRIRTVEYSVELVAAGVGAALVPEDPSFYNNRKLKLLPIENMKFERMIGLAYPKDTEIDETLQSVIDVCKVNKSEEL
jgi:DNA-binding transcriptional LysR family regulator